MKRVSTGGVELIFTGTVALSFEPSNTPCHLKSSYFPWPMFISLFSFFSRNYDEKSSADCKVYGKAVTASLLRRGSPGCIFNVRSVKRSGRVRDVYAVR